MQNTAGGRIVNGDVGTMGNIPPMPTYYRMMIKTSPNIHHKGRNVEVDCNGLCAHSGRSRVLGRIRLGPGPPQSLPGHSAIIGYSLRTNRIAKLYHRLIGRAARSDRKCDPSRPFGARLPSTGMKYPALRIPLVSAAQALPHASLRMARASGT